MTIMIILYCVLTFLVIFCLAMFRARIISKAATDWNYYVYKYTHHCSLHYTEEEKPMCRIQENEVSRREAILVFVMFWKISPPYFFDFKPDFDDIHELYLMRK